MITTAEFYVGPNVDLVEAEWTHLPDEPWFVEVDFRGHNSTWLWSLDLLRQAAYDPKQDMWGTGDVRMGIFENDLLVEINVPAGAADIYFPLKEVREFLSQIDDSNAQMILGQKLDEFLETL